jgi:hypothetical protein
MSGVALEDRPVKLAISEANEISDGLVLYQGDEERVHYLNRTASLVYELCTGENTVEDIARLIADAFALDRPPVQDVCACLVTLREQEVVR